MWRLLLLVLLLNDLFGVIPILLYLAVVGCFWFALGWGEGEGKLKRIINYNGGFLCKVRDEWVCVWLRKMEGGG